MLSLRRYAVYVGLVACFLLILNYFREPLVVKAGLKQGPAARPDATIVETTPEKPSIPEPAAHEPVKEPSTSTSSTASESYKSGFRWDKIPVRYPVTSLTSLPTDPPKKLPQVQYDFDKETGADALKRKIRLKAVRDAFERCWEAYRKHAWMKDELAPLSGGFTRWLWRMGSEPRRQPRQSLDYGFQVRI